MSDCKHIALALGVATLLAGCGQTGKLYLPEPAGEVVTRPTQTPPPETPTPSISPQTPDSPAGEEKDKDDKKNPPKDRQ